MEVYYFILFYFIVIQSRLLAKLDLLKERYNGNLSYSNNYYIFIIYFSNN